MHRNVKQKLTTFGDEKKKNHPAEELKKQPLPNPNFHGPPEYLMVRP